MNNRFTFHCDNGHGWLEVSQSDLDSAGGGRLRLFAPRAPVVTENYTNGLSSIRDMANIDVANK